MSVTTVIALGRLYLTATDCPLSMRGTANHHSTHQSPQGPHGVETKNPAEINLDRRTRPVDLFVHEIYDLFESECSRIPDRFYLAAIMNLLSNSSILYPEASLRQLRADARGRGGGGGRDGVGWGGVL